MNGGRNSPKTPDGTQLRPASFRARSNRRSREMPCAHGPPTTQPARRVLRACPGAPRAATVSRCGIGPRRWCRPAQRGDRQCGSGEFDRAVVGAGELVCTVDPRCFGIVARRLNHARGDRRRCRVRHARGTGDAGADGGASLGRPAPIRGPAHGNGAPARGRVTATSRRAARAVRTSSCPDSSASTPPGAAGPWSASGRRRPQCADIPRTR
jgi:hypothetical protein